MNKEVYLTQEGLDSLKKELDYLKLEKRPEVINALKDARALGDLSENAEYDAARNEQAIVENRIKELEMLVSVLQEQVKTLKLDVMYLQKQIDNNAAWIEHEEKSKILL